jgi:hypothetical protein
VPVAATDMSKAKSTDFITRYFLRRLAVARRKAGNKEPSVAYSEAKVETIVVVLLMPAIAIISVVGLGSLRFFTPSQVAEAHLPSKVTFALILWILCAVVGNFWLDPRFKKYLSDPSACLGFDSDHDRRIAGQQKALTILICAVVLPALTLLITFWSYW